nr:hypothetical protein [Tanacetum cinerariifolium]
LDTFYNALNPNDQDGSRVTDVRSNTNATLSSSQSNSFDLQQIAAALEDKLDIRMNRFEKSLNEMKNSIVTPTAPLKAVTEVCVTCGSNHNYNQCPLTRGGNDYPVFHDNIQQFQTAALESKSKVRYSRSRVTDVRANVNATLSSSSHSNSFDLQQIAAALEDKLDIRMNRFEKSLNEMKNSLVTPTAPLKAVTEVCVTCGSNHSYN